MNHLPRNTWGAALALVGGAALIASAWSPRVGLSVAAGGLWNIANLWCLVRLLDAWLGQSSKRRAIGWALVKFPVLYGAVFFALSRPGLSVVGFGLGFTLVLLTAIAWMAARAGALVARS
jgi:hypothetical protein